MGVEDWIDKRESEETVSMLLIPDQSLDHKKNKDLNLLHLSLLISRYNL